MEFYLGSPARQKQSQKKIMNMDWEAEWDDLSNNESWETEWDDLNNNESWVPETHLAGSTQKVVQGFRKRWNRYFPSFSATLIR